MTQARTAAGHAMGAARDLSGAARDATYAAGQAAVVAHVAAHDWAPRPTRSRPLGRRLPKTTAWMPAVWSASGSARSSQEIRDACAR